MMIFSHGIRCQQTQSGVEWIILEKITQDIKFNKYSVFFCDKLF